MLAESAQSPEQYQFVCDAMLGGLARWLRAAGYDAYWRYGQADAELIQLTQQKKAVLLTSDGGIMERNIVRDGTVRALFIPHQLNRYQQLAFVLGQLKLGLGEARCMGCGGQLEEVAREQVREKVPPKAWSCHDRFFRCQRCGTILWRGTHWKRIAERLAHIDEYLPPFGNEQRPT